MQRSTPTRKNNRPASLRGSGAARTVLLRMAADQERADRIRALKLERPDLTWRRIADAVGVTERSATDWQKKGGIDYENAKKLAAVFEVDTDYIWRGPSDGERAPSPFAGQDALADRLDRIEATLGELRQEREQGIREVHALLNRQESILNRIEQAITREEESARRDDESARRLDAAVQRARQLLAGETPDPAEAPARQAK